MHLVDNAGQVPAADDINPDSLEYLFAQSGPKRGKTPWVEMAGGSEQPVARITPEYVRLNTKVELLKGALELTQEQLHEAHHRMGMLAAELARRDELLKELADYRVRAALTIGYQRQNELLRTHVNELNAQLKALAAVVSNKVPDHESAKPAVTPTESVTAENYVLFRPKLVFPMALLNAVLVLAFATLVLTILFRWAS